MKLLMITGALLGFGIGFVFSLLQKTPWPSVIWHACVAAYVSALLLRWWGRLWERSLRSSLVERQVATARASSPTTPKK